MLFLILIYLTFISLGLPDSLLGSSWPLMNSDLGVSTGSAGLVSFIITSGTILSSLFSHSLISLWGTGKITLTSVFMTAIALLGFSFSHSFLWLLLCSIPLGLGAGAVDAGLNKFVAEHYEAKHMNWLHAFWGVGAMLAPLLMSVLLFEGNTWRGGYLTISSLQMAIVILLVFSLPVWKRVEASPISIHGEAEDKRQPALLSTLSRRGALWGLLSFFLVASIEASMMLWGSTYLVKQEQVSPESAAGWVSLFFLGMTAGRMLSGWISSRWSNETLIRFGSVLTLLGFIVMLLPLPTPFTLTSFILVGSGLAPIFPSMLHQTPQYYGQHAPAAMGAQMACAYTGTTLVAPGMGQLLSFISFSFFPYLLLACSAGLLLSRELFKWRTSDLP
ncbi:transporter, major facilitator family protein [Paenibacillus algicola]|uniref:Transporter, major facilitator family protein n=1 Tax=Paenibacillus algicola TaxID=2565926 RepID=A0A4V1G3Z2_9BACL|nr:MFS transporter [Paenibacillus algicola]QCT02884.1 transporter, major facilitator family protein [Paenibacillus algicola]